MQKKNENKKNKKVVVVAAMALLLALVGISGGETYAKYASNQTDDATATVAKWGYTVSANANELFGKQYGAADANKLSPVNGSGINVVGKSTNVIAPGTKGSSTFTVAGDAEVLSAITVDFEIRDIVLFANSTSETISGYKPLSWKLTVVDTGSIGFNKTFNGYENVVNAEDEINDTYKHVNANTTVSLTMTLTWEWAFSVNDVNDRYDTVFGGLSNKVLSYDSNGVALTWKQVDADGDPSTPETINDNKYTYQNGTTNDVYTDNNSVFETLVNGSVTVSQIQDLA